MMEKGGIIEEQHFGVSQSRNPRLYYYGNVEFITNVSSLLSWTRLIHLGIRMKLRPSEPVLWL